MMPQSSEPLGSDVTFGAAVDEVAFPASIKQMTVVNTDPYLNDLLIKYCEQALSARSTKQSSFRIGCRETSSRFNCHMARHA